MKNSFIPIISSVLILLTIAILGLANYRNSVLEQKSRVIKIGLILNGVQDDFSWGSSHVTGLKKAVENLNAELLVEENVGAGREFEAVVEKFIDEDCLVIAADSIEYENSMVRMAEKYPEKYFLHATGTAEAKNLVTFFGRIYQMRYLSGIVAGLQTESNHVCYVAAMKIPEVVRGINSFALGVKKVNPNATVHVIFTDDWNDEAAAAEKTEQLLKKYPSIDVLTTHLNCQKPLEIAEKCGIWTIGYNYDASDLYPETYLTAPVWCWENFYAPEIRNLMVGKFNGGNYWYDESSGIMGIAPLTKNVKPGIKEAVDREMNVFENGLYDVFYGPIVDNEGRLRVNAGENISDKTLLNDIDWYVQGVLVYE